MSNTDSTRGPFGKNSTLPQSVNINTGFGGSPTTIVSRDLGMPGPRNNTSSNLGMPAYGSLRSNKTVKEFAGVSGNQVQITTNGFRLKTWGKKRLQDQLFEGELCFTHNSGATQLSMTALNLRFVNEIWKQEYNFAVLFVKEILNKGQGIDGFFTDEELRELLSTPTEAWDTNPNYARALRSDIKIIKRLRYLNLNSIKNDWNFYGTFLGQMQGGEDAPFYVSSMVRRGIVREASNVWGMGVAGSKHLYVIKTRKYLGSGQYGPPAMIPWQGYGSPTLNDISYIDVSGNVAYGECIYVGTVLWWVDKPKSNLPFGFYAGLQEPPNYLKGIVKKPIDARFRIIIRYQKGTKINFTL